ncbi:MAG: hypothetical protein HKK67_08585 [Chlorobiaceae bacterium]|nr:hypothetical protein [Chlorobiaceae bacterium]
MKKTAKLLSLAVALFAGLGGTAQAADGFKIGADVVSSYVWRGSDIGDSPAIQPSVTYTFPGSGVIVGAWGSYAFTNNGLGRYKEADLYATLPLGPFSATLTDYNTNSYGRAFDYTTSGPNTLEASVGYEKDDLSLLGAINIGGVDYNHAKYLEAGYKFSSKDGYTAKAVIGAGNEVEYAAGMGTGFKIVNLGISVSKDRFTGAYIYNPDTEKSNLVFTASF